MSLTFCLFYVREATVGCVAADCNPVHQKHRWFDSNRVHQFQCCHRLSVRTNGFQPLERGSTPRGSANFQLPSSSMVDALSC